MNKQNKKQQNKNNTSILKHTNTMMKKMMDSKNELNIYIYMKIII